MPNLGWADDLYRQWLISLSIFDILPHIVLENIGLLFIRVTAAIIKFSQIYKPRINTLINESTSLTVYISMTSRAPALALLTTGLGGQLQKENTMHLILYEHLFINTKIIYKDIYIDFGVPSSVYVLQCAAF